MTTKTQNLLLACGAFGALLLGSIGGCTSDADPVNTSSSSSSSSSSGTGGSAETCPTGQTMCGGNCTLTNLDRDNCGGCGTKCNDDQVCSEGLCASDCTGGTTKCGDVCVNLYTDQQNCGACGKPCPAGSVCDGNGGCKLSCQAGLTECSGQCVNLDTDATHCGDCETACMGAQICNGEGTCAMTCQPGLVACGGACINPLTEEEYCGASGDCMDANAGVKCGQAELCNNGTCEAVTCNDQWETTANSNDTEGTAEKLVADPLSDCADAESISGVINGANDVDWYYYEGDDALCAVNPKRTFNQVSADARLCAFFQCIDPDATTQFSCPTGTVGATSPAGRFGCCDTGTTVSFSPKNLNCTGTINEDILVYIRVDDPNATSGTCTSYSFDYNY